MGKVDEVKVKSKDGQEYVIINDGHHYRATKDGQPVAHPFIEVANLLAELNIEIDAFDAAAAGVNTDGQDASAGSAASSAGAAGSDTGSDDNPA